MPFGLRLGKRSQQYNVANKDLFVIPIEILTNEPIECIECTLLASSTGQECLNNVCQRLNLQQPEYFGLLFKSKRGLQQWVDPLKAIKKQLDKYGLESRLLFRLQFFVPDIHFLSDEVTRYNYFCALKLLVIEGRLACGGSEAVMLASYRLQAEFGDFNAERHTAQYLNNFTLLPPSVTSNNKAEQDRLMESIINAYRNLQGVPPNVAEIYYISEAQQLTCFGQEGFPAKDADSGHDVCLGVSLNGIFVVNYNSQNTQLFKWTEIANLIHQKKVFTVELNPDGLRKNFATFDSDYASFVWRSCVEQHQYFMKGVRNSFSDFQHNEHNKREQFVEQNVANGGHNFQNQISIVNRVANGMQNTKRDALSRQSLQNSRHIVATVNCDDQQYAHYSENMTHALYNSYPTTESSTDTTGSQQIQVSYMDQRVNEVNEVTCDTQSNITTVQVHDEPSWALADSRAAHLCDSELSFEQRKLLLPPYKHPPDYETFIRQKYGSLSVSLGNITSLGIDNIFYKYVINASN